VTHRNPLTVDLLGLLLLSTKYSFSFLFSWACSFSVSLRRPFQHSVSLIHIFRYHLIPLFLKATINLVLPIVQFSPFILISPYHIGYLLHILPRWAKGLTSSSNTSLHISLHAYFHSFLGLEGRPLGLQSPTGGPFMRSKTSNSISFRGTFVSLSFFAVL